MYTEQITYSNYFGKISKVRWYRVTDNFNTYLVQLYIFTSQTTASNALIQNRSNQNGIEWQENVPANTTSAIIGRDVSLVHVPTLKAREYVVINQAV